MSSGDGREKAAELRDLARRLNDMADELDPPRRRWPVEPAAAVTDELARERARAKLKRMGKL